MKKILSLLVFILLFLGVSTLVQATTITADVLNLGGTLWQYNYTVINDTLSDPIKEFWVYFDYGLYQGLQVDSSVAGWTEQVVEPMVASSIPQDGFYYAISSIGIVPGGTQDGFMVSFEWLGVGDFATPGEQEFEVYGEGFVLLDLGLTNPSSVTVPEPGVLVLLCSGLLYIAGLRRMIGD